MELFCCTSQSFGTGDIRGILYKIAALRRHLVGMGSSRRLCCALPPRSVYSLFERHLCSSHLSSARTRTRIGNQPRVPPIYPPASHRDLNAAFYAASLHRLQGDSLAIPSFSLVCDVQQNRDLLLSSLDPASHLLFSWKLLGGNPLSWDDPWVNLPPRENAICNKA
jgi:hypothetical protein